MSHEPLLRRAANPAPYRVLGLPLRPFSIGHALLLSEEEDSQPVPQAVALAAAVWICASTWKENCRLRCSVGARFKLAAWRWRCRLRRPVVAQEVAKFRAYIAQGSAEFPYSGIIRADRPQGGRELGAPYLLQLQQFLMLRFNLQEAAAWDYRLGLAKMRWATYAEEQGWVEILNAPEEAFDRKVAEAEKQGAKTCPV